MIELLQLQKTPPTDEGRKRPLWPHFHRQQPLLTSTWWVTSHRVLITKRPTDRPPPPSQLFLFLLPLIRSVRGRRVECCPTRVRTIMHFTSCTYACYLVTATANDWLRSWEKEHLSEITLPTTTVPAVGSLATPTLLQVPLLCSRLFLWNNSLHQTGATRSAPHGAGATRLDFLMAFPHVLPSDVSQSMQCCVQEWDVFIKLLPSPCVVASESIVLVCSFLPVWRPTNWKGQEYWEWLQPLSGLGKVKNKFKHLENTFFVLSDIRLKFQ